MLRALFLLATLAVGLFVRAESSGRFLVPSYSKASIVNSATNAPGALAPNTLATVYGSNLAYSTHGLSPDDIRSGALPTVLAGVRVYVANQPANLYYVSPQQVNFLIPSRLLPGDVDIWVFREGTVGPKISVTLVDSAPALFQASPEMIVATHSDGAVVTRDTPARPGEVVVLYAAGLGRTSPDVIDGRIPLVAAPIRRLNDLRVLLGGEAVESGRIAYAGQTPGFAGLYQINLKLPDKIVSDPEIQLSLGEQASPSALKLAAQP